MISLLDLFTGNFTWTELVRELAPLVMVGTSAFFAGYWRGRNVECRFWRSQGGK